VGRNNRETESAKNIPAGHEVEGQQETTASLAVSVPGCSHAARGDPRPSAGRHWEQSQHSALGSPLTFPLQLTLFLFSKSVDVPANQR